MAISEVIRAVSSKSLGGPWELEPWAQGGARSDWHCEEASLTSVVVTC